MSADDGWRAGQWATGVLAALMMAAALGIASGVVPLFGARESAFPAWGWVLGVIVALLAGLLAAAYSAGGWSRKCGVLATVFLAAAIVVLAPFLTSYGSWAEGAGLGALQPLIALIAVLALVLAVILAVRRPVVVPPADDAVDQ